MTVRSPGADDETAEQIFGRMEETTRKSKTLQFRCTQLLRTKVQRVIDRTDSEEETMTLATGSRGRFESVLETPVECADRTTDWEIGQWLEYSGIQCSIQPRWPPPPPATRAWQEKD